MTETLIAISIGVVVLVTLALLVAVRPKGGRAHEPPEESR